MQDDLRPVQWSVWEVGKEMQAGGPQVQSPSWLSIISGLHILILMQNEDPYVDWEGL